MAGTIADLLQAVIIGAQTPCTLSLPQPADPAKPLDVNLLDVLLTPTATNVPEHIVKVNDASDCDLNVGEGWYFDDPTAPTRIVVCPGSCAKFATGRAEIAEGCLPVRGATH